jgi:hypothetical protein
VKVITTPTVTLVSAPLFHPHPVYQLPPHDLARCREHRRHGRQGLLRLVRHRRQPGHAARPHARDSGHHSVLEHVHVGVLIEGISRGCSHEIVRHRMFNYSQRSTRYTAEDDAAIVLDPYFARIYALPEACSAHENDMVGRFLEECEASVAAYAQLVEDLLEANPEQLTVGISGSGAAARRGSCSRTRSRRGW